VRCVSLTCSSTCFPDLRFDRFATWRLALSVSQAVLANEWYSGWSGWVHLLSVLVNRRCSTGAIGEVLHSVLRVSHSFANFAARVALIWVLALSLARAPSLAEAGCPIRALTRAMVCLIEDNTA
jgi:hypothetical protein